MCGVAEVKHNGWIEGLIFLFGWFKGLILICVCKFCVFSIVLVRS